MAVKTTELKKLTMRSGGRCAFPDCRTELTVKDSSREIVVLGNVAHIVAQQDGGPRSDPAMDPSERDLYGNLVLLCTHHHQLIDSPSGPESWTVSKLRALKEAHESWVRDRLENSDAPAEMTLQTDTAYSTLLPVESMPTTVYSAETDFKRAQDLRNLQRGHKNLIVSTIHSGRLWTFHDLRSDAGPFHSVVERSTTERHSLAELRVDPDLARLLQRLFNQSLNKLTGRLGVRLDPDHHRYFFPCDEGGLARTVQYRTMTGRSSTLSVAWQPVVKKTGETRPFWFHRAINLGFVDIGGGDWVLSMRPEFHVTENGTTLLPSSKIGAKVTKKKSRMFNGDLFAELEFWRYFLSRGQPRIVLRYTDDQAAIISSSLVNGDVSWPGIPAEFDLPYSNSEYEDDLLSLIDAVESDVGSSDEAEWDDEVDLVDE
ncbi:MAG: HNH endonuclease [Actinomycetota bacterium]